MCERRAFVERPCWPQTDGGTRQWRAVRPVWVYLLAGFVLGWAPQLFAETGSLDFDGGSVRYSVFAPEWIWQRQNINILMAFESELATTATVVARLGAPPYNARAVRYDGPASRTLRLGPGARGRLAFANILALDKVKVSAAPGTGETGRRADAPITQDREKADTDRVEKVATGQFFFPIQLAAAAGDQTRTAQLVCAVRTVRGAAVSEGLGAMLLPVGLILGWCVLVFLIVPRMAEPGAWLRPSEPFDAEEAVPQGEPSDGTAPSGR